MNTAFNKLVILLLGVTLFSACKKDETIDYFQGGTAPVLAANQNDSIPLAFTTASKTAVTFSWTNPGYMFTTGVSSQDVTYQLEMDTAGSNFSNPLRKVISISKDLAVTLSQNTLNSYLLNDMLLVADMPHTIEVRITASIGSVPATSLKSNVLSFTITPYSIPPAVAPPTTGQLFLVGSATVGGWSNPVPVPSQQFTQVSPTEYKITVSLTGGQEFLFLPLNGDWGSKYAAPDPGTTGIGSPGNFQFYYSGGNNFKGPDASGTYVIDVNFQTGKFTVTPQ